MRSWNSEYAVRDQRKMINTESIIAPIGSNHHFNFDPPTLVKTPNPLMKRSFLWSSQRMRIWLYVLRRAKQYRKRQNLVVKAMATTMVDAS